MKKYFFLKLNPPRSTFMQDMTAEERSVMQQHVEYWKKYVNDGTALVLGPVADLSGGYGIAVVAVESEDQLQKIISADPANGLNKYEWHPMPRVATKG
ncbi:MAG TPA: YciI family protein [Bacteroidia bacterium]|jgi:uncharacterized protein YciI|nr:YciI family protein [Bacteroidia bacterium]